ncbi:membrane-associated protein, putative [Bodo saltans]|uniref:Membrane-associated protein, putative n=1 Tax=Bodo saltans TaxID=75058 RepID=A0A0S4JQH5_BODSA|nr:membrane-associated protein, putative [Bodo saltans]|eukprot:CUG92791.1 membrane-associated protein, putative [Bodo saltans]
MSSRCRRYCFLSFADVVLTCLLALSIGLGVGTKGASCAYAPIIIAVLYFLYAAVLMALRPHRLVSDVVFAPISSALFGAMCVCKYVGSSTSVLETVLSVVQITQMLLRLLALFREWEWRELVPEPAAHADAARGKYASGNILHVTMMQDDLDDDDVCLDDIEMQPAMNVELEVDGAAAAVQFWNEEDGEPIRPPNSSDDDDPLASAPPPPPPKMNEAIRKKRSRSFKYSERKSRPPIRTQQTQHTLTEKRSPTAAGLLLTMMDNDGAGDDLQDQSMHHTTFLFNAED